MTFLEIFFLWVGFLLILSAFALQKTFRYLAFFSGVWLGIFVFFPGVLQKIGQFFGLDRGADLLVYLSVIFLFFGIIYLVKKNEIFSHRLTLLVREMALEKSEKNFLNTKNTLVIAAYNEEKVIESTIRKIFSHFDGVVLVVNDGSSDTTKQKIISLQKEFSKLLLLSHTTNLGQGAALETGFEYIRRGNINTKFITTFDADGQHDILDLSKMEQFLEKNTNIEIVLWSRFLEKSPKNMPFFRKIIIKGGILFTRLLSGISLTDTHNGFRVIRKEALQKIRITLDGMWHASEIIDTISHKNIAFTEMPVTISYSDYSLNKGQNSMNSIKIACKMLFKKFF